jgi:glutamate mutase epsilon subunit
MTHEQLQAVSDTSAANLKRLFDEGATELLQSISDCEEEAHNQSKDKITVKIAHSITLDLVKNTQHDAITFGVRRKLEVASAIDDPNQMKLPLD